MKKTSQTISTSFADACVYMRQCEYIEALEAHAEVLSVYGRAADLRADTAAKMRETGDCVASAKAGRDAAITERNAVMTAARKAKKRRQK